MWRYKRSKKVSYGVLFEVGSGSVAGAIVTSSKNAKTPIILYATREFLPLKQTVLIEDITKRLLTIFMSVTLTTENKIAEFIPKNAHIDQVNINFTAPWSHTRNCTYTLTSPEPVLVTPKLIEQTHQTGLITGEVSSHPALDTIAIINRSIFGYTVNNYQIKNPIGQQATHFSITETVSAVTKTVFTPTEEIVRKLFPQTPIYYSSSPLIQQNLIKAEVAAPTTFATIHLTHEALELTIYRNCEITVSFSTPVGLNTMARNIATTSHIPHEQVYNFLTTDTTTTHQKSMHKQVVDGFTKAVLEPMATFFSSVHSTEQLPQTIYVITTLMPSPITLECLAKALHKATKGKNILTNLNTPLIHCTAQATIGTNDLGICSLAYFFHNNQQMS